MLCYFQHHRVRISSILNQGFLEHKGATWIMRFLLYSSSIAMGLVHFTIKNEQNVPYRNMSLVTSSDCPQLLHSRYCLQWVSVQKFYLLNCFLFSVLSFLILCSGTLFCQVMFLIPCLMSKYFSFLSHLLSRLKYSKLQVCHSICPTLCSANTHSGIKWSQLLLYLRWILPSLPSARSHGAWLSSTTAM